MSASASSLREGLKKAGLDTEVRALRPARALRIFRKALERTLRKIRKAQEGEAAAVRDFAAAWRAASGLAGLALRTWDAKTKERDELAARLTHELGGLPNIAAFASEFRRAKSIQEVRALSGALRGEENTPRAALGLPPFSRRAVHDRDVIDVLFVRAQSAEARAYGQGLPISARSEEARARAKLRRFAAVEGEGARLKGWPSLMRLVLQICGEATEPGEIEAVEDDIALLRDGLQRFSAVPAKPEARRIRATS